MNLVRSKLFFLFASCVHTFLLIAIYKFTNPFVDDFHTANNLPSNLETIITTSIKRLSIMPEDDPHSDRIVDQLSLAELLGKQSKKTRRKTKKIFLSEHWNYISHEFHTFFNDCPVSECQVTQTRRNDLDAYLFRELIPFSRSDSRRQNEIWIYYSLESPYSYAIDYNVDYINWTATYRLDSDIVTPYGKFVQNSFNKSKTKQQINYAEGKKKKVAWFVSNCGANNQRLEYARELSRYIKVDIFGSCGKKHCSRSEANDCFELLRKDYKFYLSFENSNCRHYITEKFFVNALQNNVIPVVMGARKEDYEQLAPPNSFIHVDDFESTKSLAQYLHKLDLNDRLYNSYFEWKDSGEFINTQFWCRLCALLHSDYKSKHYKDLRKWWQSDDVCVGNQRRL